MNTDNDQATFIFVHNGYKAEQMQDKIAKENALANIAGYLLDKTFNKHECSVCKTALTNNKTLTCTHTFYMKMTVHCLED